MPSKYGENKNKTNCKKQVEEKHSSEDSFEQECTLSTQFIEPKKELSEFFTQYSETLKGVSVKDCLNKYKEELKASKINFNESCFQPEMSMVIIKHSTTYEMVTLFVSFSYFSFEISAINLSKESFSQSYLEILGRGTYGKVYQTKINDENVAIKSIEYLDDFLGEKKETNNKESSNTISKAIFEYCLYKLFSVFEIGPKLINIFGFDLLICKNTVEFSMEKCEKNHQKFLEYLYSSLDLIHSFGIIHGDIKPDNIMWSPSFQKWVIIDFGLSKVIRERPGEKTFTKYFGTFQNSSAEMKNLFHSSNSEFVDLYYNDLFGLNAVFDGFVGEVKKGEKEKIVSSIKPFANFVENSQLCYALYTLCDDDFSCFCEELTKTFILLDIFWNIMKNTDIYPRTLLMFKRLSHNISDPDNVINSYLTSLTKKESTEIKKEINFLWRFQQRVIQFNGVINDIMLYSLIYLNNDISPLRYEEKETLLKTLKHQFEPSNEKYWKDLLKLLKNPYVIYEEVVAVFENVKNTIGIKDWIKCDMKEHGLHVKGRQIAGVCIAKYGFNLFELNSKNYLSDELLSESERHIKAKIFEFSEFSNIIKKYENEFPYLEFLTSLQKYSDFEEFISHLKSNLKRIQEKYKIKELPIALKLFQSSLEKSFSISLNSKKRNFIESFRKHPPTLEFLNNSNSSEYVKQAERVFYEENQKEIFDKILKEIKERCFMSIFQIEESVESFFQENFQLKKLEGNGSNILDILIQNFYETFEKFVPLRDYKYYCLINNLVILYNETYSTFSNDLFSKIETKLVEIVSEALDEKLTLTKLFILICKVFKLIKHNNPKIIKFKNHENIFKVLFRYFDSQNLSKVTKIYLLSLKIALYQNEEVLQKNEYSSLLNQAVKSISQIQSESLKMLLFSHKENLDIFVKYFLTIDSIESKKEKEGEVELLLKYGYHENGNFQLFHIIMEAIVVFYSYGEECEFEKIMKVLIRGTYFKNKCKKEEHMEMQKFIIADYAIEQFLSFYEDKKHNKFKEDVFSFIENGINSEKDKFYIRNGNFILLIEKVFKLRFNRLLFLNDSQIIWLLKVSSRLIKYSNLAFSRSFYAAMNYWFYELVIKSGIQMNIRKKKNNGKSFYKEFTIYF